jgi:hypothetical protein
MAGHLLLLKVWTTNIIVRISNKYCACQHIEEWSSTFRRMISRTLHTRKKDTVTSIIIAH